MGLFIQANSKFLWHSYFGLHFITKNLTLCKRKNFRVGLICYHLTGKIVTTLS